MAKDYGTEDFTLKPVFFSESDVFHFVIFFPHIKKIINDLVHE